jgi:putative DNA primase/helicase
MNVGNLVPKDLNEALYERRKEVYRLAHNKWPDILRGAGVDEVYLRLRKSGPCPLCKNGTDRYTFTDRDGDGDYICRHCGTGPKGGGKGVTFLMRFNDWSWSRAVDWVLEFIADPEANRLLTRKAEIRARQRARLSSPDEEAKRRAKMKAVWEQASRVTTGDPVDLYLRSRVPGLEEIPSVIRFHPALEYFQYLEESESYVSRGRHPAMLAAVTDVAGRCCNVHRTYLSPSGKKATITDEDGVIITDERGNALDVRKQMPAVPSVSPSIKLFAGEHNHLGVAEGIETSLAGSVFAKVPTWSVISTSGMRGFVIPEWVSALTIFADNDPPDSKGNRPGFDAAHALARRDDVVQRVKARTLRVMVRTPSRSGMDIADLLMGIADRLKEGTRRKELAQAGEG